MAFVAALVIMANRQQTSIFTLRAGVRLHADGVIAGQFHQPVGKLGDHLLIPFRLLDRAERVQLGEFRPVIGIISAAAFSFMVQEPSGIIARFSARSLRSGRACSASSRFRYGSG